MIKKILRRYISQDRLNIFHKFIAIVAAARYGFPSKKLRLIGITGTNGKTSVCHYVTQLLEDAGKRVGMLTTVAISINGERQLNKTKMTTLDSFTLQRHLKKIVEAGCEYAVIETTSHALDQNRVYGLYFEIVAITNVTHEHLDYHKTMAKYQKAKEKLFAHRPKVAVVNADDPTAKDFLRYSATHKFTYGILDHPRPKEALANPDFGASQLKSDHDKTIFRLTTPFNEDEITVPLPGKFTISNILAAVAIATSQSCTFEQIKATLSRLRPVEGRMEPVEAGQPYSIIVDFAHTPDALSQVYSTIRPMVKGRLIAVLGSMGDRDKTKRPILGALAGRYADLVIITNEDPVTEDPMAIINEVASGVPRGRSTHSGDNKGEGEWWWKIEDRRKAIAKALSMAKKDDTVLVTGKGGEHVMAVRDRLIPWNDVEVIKDIISRDLDSV